GFERAVEVIEDGDEITDERLGGVPRTFFAVTLRAPADVVGLRERAQQTVVFLGELTPALVEGVGGTGGRVDGVGVQGRTVVRRVHGGNYSNRGAVRTGGTGPAGRGRALR